MRLKRKVTIDHAINNYLYYGDRHRLVYRERQVISNENYYKLFGDLIKSRFDSKYSVSIEIA